MRSLRFVHLAGDGTHLVLETADGGEQFVLPNDAFVREAMGSATTEAVDVAKPTLPPIAPAVPVAALSAAPVTVAPREIQTRVRAGESPEQLAASLGVPIERIARFAAPVVEERLRIADEARRARARRSSNDGQVVVFGETVDARFTAHGIAATDVTWDARRRDDGEWVVVAQWHRGEGRHDAEWIFSRSARSVTPLDDTASDLLSDRPVRPFVAVAAAENGSPTAPALFPGVVAFPPMPEAHTGPLPRLEEVFDQETARDGSGARHSFADEPGVDFDAPALPLALTDAAGRPAVVAPRLSSVRTESDDERAARVRVPSWDDILLGVRRKQD